MGDFNVDVAREDGERCIGFNLHVGMLGFRVLCPPGSTYKCKSYNLRWSMISSCHLCGLGVDL